MGYGENDGTLGLMIRLEEDEDPSAVLDELFDNSLSLDVKAQLLFGMMQSSELSSTFGKGGTTLFVPDIDAKLFLKYELPRINSWLEQSLGEDSSLLVVTVVDEKTFMDMVGDYVKDNGIPTLQEPWTSFGNSGLSAAATAEIEAKVLFGHMKGTSNYMKNVKSIQVFPKSSINIKLYENVGKVGNVLVGLDVANAVTAPQNSPEKRVMKSVIIVVGAFASNVGG